MNTAIDEAGTSPVLVEEKDQPRADFQQFLIDVEPFFRGIGLVYVDAGAYDGDTFRDVYNSPLIIQSAYLFEPNTESFRLLEKTVRELEAEEITTCYNLALSSTAQRLKLHEAGTMTRIIDLDSNLASKAASKFVEAEAMPLDDLVQKLPTPHVSLLKIDVEGHEHEVLSGASSLLKRQAVDVIYIEAGVNPSNKQQTYYRDVEDTLNSYGYRMFRVYEQTPEWVERSPLLRRFNIGFFSEALVARNLHVPSSGKSMMRSLSKSVKENLSKLEASGEPAQRAPSPHSDQASLITAYQKKLQEMQGSNAVLSASLNQLKAIRTQEKVRRDVALFEAEQKLERQAGEIDQLKASLSTRFTEIAQLTKVLNDLSESSRQKIKDYSRRNRRLKAQVELQSQQISRSKKMLESASSNVNHLQARIDALNNSMSWRLLQPARSLVSMIRGRR